MIELKVGDRVRPVAGEGEWGVLDPLIDIQTIHPNGSANGIDEDGETWWVNDPDEDWPVEIATDPVNHPAHYTAFGAEVIEITEHLSFNAGNAIKYLARAGLKDPDKHIEDLGKALWYVTREIERVRKLKK